MDSSLDQDLEKNPSADFDSVTLAWQVGGEGGI
jgi:hypothetical protein